KSYIPTPKALKSKRAILNIKNKDNKCFLYCVLSVLFPRNSANESASRVSNYVAHENRLNMSNIKYPVKISDIDRFERQNEISVNVFGYEGKKLIYPLRITKRMKKVHVNLLLLQRGRVTHYCLIHNFNRLLLRTTKYDHIK